MTIKHNFHKRLRSDTVYPIIECSLIELGDFVFPGFFLFFIMKYFRKNVTQGAHTISFFIQLVLPLN